ncbi:MAG: ATP-binding cassette domain-containing protein [Oscillospiraceae bacterium]|nr:ATP-binding cassette domain-containing protein [Oscillospiraceae bacterium]
MKIIKAENLTKVYGSFKAVDSISFEVGKGELIGFLGVNGAGKSTTINMLSTLLEKDGGTAEVCGEVLGRNNDAIRRKIGIVYQQNCLDGILTVKENLLCRGMIHDVSKKNAAARIKELSQILELDEILDKRYSKLSGGQKRRCEIAAALMHTPELLFLDEPTTGLDPATRKNVWEAVESLRKNTGMSVFLTTHYMEEAAKANRIIIIEKGRLLADGTPFELKERYANDNVRLFAAAENRGGIVKLLSEKGIQTVCEEDCLRFSVKKTLDSIDILGIIRDKIDGFEVIQGNMDDVFLNVCGRREEI